MPLLDTQVHTHSYTFYNNEQGELMIDYVVENNSPNEEPLSEFFKVNQDILKEIQGFEAILNFKRLMLQQQQLIEL